MSTYSTTDIRLAALLLIELPASTFTIPEQENTYQKTFQISYIKTQNDILEHLIEDFVGKKAFVNLFEYHRQINILKDALFKAGAMHR